MGASKIAGVVIASRRIKETGPLTTYYIYPWCIEAHGSGEETRLCGVEEGVCDVS